jgi:hypothetical protein
LRPWVRLPQINASGRSVSRILSSESLKFTPRRLHPCLLASAIIHLCSLPETQAERAAPSSLLDLAPDGGYLAAHITANAGGLLRRLFTMTGARQSCPEFVAESRRSTSRPRLFFSVALSDRFLRPGISPAPCPAEYGLSSTLRNGEPRSPNRPEACSSYTRDKAASTPRSVLRLTVFSLPTQNREWQSSRMACFASEARLRTLRDGLAGLFNVKLSRKIRSRGESWSRPRGSS